MGSLNESKVVFRKLLIKKIEKTFNTEYNLPVLYLPQVLGLAFGIPKEELGFQINRIKLDRVFEKISLNSERG